MGNQEYGTGLVTSYKQIVSDQLGIDPDRIDVIMGDTDRTPAGLTGGSRALAVAGAALYEAGRKHHRQGHEACRASARGRGAGRRFRRRRFQRARHRSAPRSLRRGEGRARSGEAAAGHGARARHHAYPRAAGADLPQRLPYRRGRDRSRNRCRQPRALHRGRRFRPHHQPDAARGPGPWRHRAGHRPGAARTRGLRRESGQLIAGSFMDYAMPRADDLPSFSFATHNVPSSANPLGVKGAGEAGAVGAPPAVINAIVDALHRRTGVAPHRHAGHAAARLGGAQGFVTGAIVTAGAARRRWRAAR